MRWLIALLIAAPCMAQVAFDGELKNHSACYYFDVDFGATPQSLTVSAQVALIGDGRIELELFDLDGAASLETPVRHSPLDYANAQTTTGGADATATLNTRAYDGVRQFLLIVTDAGEGATYEGTFSDTASMAVLSWRARQSHAVSGVSKHDYTIVRTPRTAHWRSNPEIRWLEGGKIEDTYIGAIFDVDFGPDPVLLRGHVEWRGTAVGDVMLHWRRREANRQAELYRIEGAGAFFVDEAVRFAVGPAHGRIELLLYATRDLDLAADGDEMRWDMFLPQGFHIKSHGRSELYPVARYNYGYAEICSGSPNGPGPAALTALALLAALCFAKARSTAKSHK